MIENMLQKIEEKVMFLLAEVERLTQEVVALKGKEETYTKKLQDLLSVLETLNVSDTPLSVVSRGAAKPALIQS